MASNVIDQLLVTLGLDSKDLDKGLARLQGTLKSVDTVINAFGVSFAGIFVKSQIDKIADMSQNFDLLSKKTGVSTEEIQSWGNAVKIQGGSAANFENTLQYLSNEMQNIAINGNSNLVPMLTRLGIAYRNVGGSLKTPIQLLKELSNKFQGLSNQQAFSLARKLGLDDGTVLLLQKGEKGLNEILNRTRKLNALNEKDIKTGVELRKGWKEIGLVFQKISVQIGAVFLPVVQKLSEWGIKLAEWLDKNGENVKNVLEGIAIVIGVSLIPKILSLTKALAALMMNPYFAVIGAAIAGFLALFDDYKVWKEGGQSLFDWGKGFEFLSKAATKCWEKLKSFWDWLKSTWFGKAAKWLWTTMNGGENGPDDEINEAIKDMLHDGLSTKDIKEQLTDSGLSDKEIEERINKVKNNTPVVYRMDDAGKLVRATTPAEPLTRNFATNTTNTTTTTTSIGNVNISAEKVDGDSIKNLANTLSDQTLALQSNYGM